MLQITTNLGKTYNASFAWAPLLDGSCGIGIQDARPLSQIAAEFDGLMHIHCVDPSVGKEYDFDGYGILARIEKTGEYVQMRLIQGGDNS